MKSKHWMKQFLLAAALLAAADAALASIVSTVGSGIRGTQTGRLSRNGVPQDYDGIEAYPGVTTPTVQYFYQTIAYTVDPINRYLSINFDTSASVFISAYLGSYNPSNLALNWIGDGGASGYQPNDPVFFNLLAAAGSTIIFVINNTVANGGGLNDLFTLSIDTAAGRNFENLQNDVGGLAVVPEPSTILLLIAPLGFIAGRKLKTRRASKEAVAVAA